MKLRRFGFVSVVVALIAVFFCAGNLSAAEEELVRVVVKKAEFKNILCKDVTDDKGNNCHNDTVYKVHNVEVFNEFCTTGDTCTNKEKNKTELTEELESTLVGHNVDLTDA